MMPTAVARACLSILLLAGAAMAVDLTPPVPEENPKLVSGAVDTLVGVRAALDHYAKDHRGEYPDFRQFPAFEQLTNKTESNGVISARGKCGPYLDDRPTNPLRPGRNVTVVPAERSLIVEAEAGFIFDDRNRLFLIDSKGHKVDEKLTVQHPSKEPPLPTLARKSATSTTSPAPTPGPATTAPARVSGHTLVATDMQHLMASANELARGLSADQQEEFERSLAILNGAAMDKAQRQLCVDLDGKTVAQTVAMARTVARDNPAITTAAADSLLQQKLQLASNLTAIVRAQLDTYRRQHGDELPNFVRYANFEQMTRKTNQLGEIAADAALGPYLDAAPINPLRKASAVVMTDFAGRDKVISDPAVGWILIEGRLYPLDSNGHCILER
jgi:hypothetical protein